MGYLLCQVGECLPYPGTLAACAGLPGQGQEALLCPERACVGWDLRCEMKPFLLPHGLPSSPPALTGVGWGWGRSR